MNLEKLWLGTTYLIYLRDLQTTEMELQSPPLAISYSPVSAMDIVVVSGSLLWDTFNWFQILAYFSQSKPPNYFFFAGGSFDGKKS